MIEFILAVPVLVFTLVMLLSAFEKQNVMDKIMATWTVLGILTSIYLVGLLIRMVI